MNIVRLRRFLYIREKVYSGRRTRHTNQTSRKSLSLPSRKTFYSFSMMLFQWKEENGSYITARIKLMENVVFSNLLEWFGHPFGSDPFDFNQSTFSPPCIAFMLPVQHLLCLLILDLPFYYRICLKVSIRFLLLRFSPSLFLSPDFCTHTHTHILS